MSEGAGSKRKAGRLLTIGDRIPLGPDVDLTADSYLGEGSQREVYLVSIGDKQFALKWLWKTLQEAALRDSLTQLVMEGPPSTVLLWPKQVVSFRGMFGYLRDLYPPGYEGSHKLLSREISWSY